MSRVRGYRPVIEYCGGTEIGGGFLTGSMLQPQALSAFSTPAMGCTVVILDENQKPLVSFFWVFWLQFDTILFHRGESSI